MISRTSSALGYLLRLVFAVGWIVANSLHGQPTATGTIQGRVYNPVSREYVNNAEVRLEGTNQVTFTESDGSFKFAQVASGDATIAVTYSGYNSVRETLTVTPGLTATREIILTSTASGAARPDGTVKLDAFTVSGEREGNSKAIMSQRRNMDITTSVASDIFGDVMDGNVGEFLKYLPGVDIEWSADQPRAIRIQGLDPQYTAVTVDGERVLSCLTLAASIDGAAV
ncbi:MAG: carboxypeptidase-like regulatory domain-containing protein, partial [Phycisphaerales bacterium]|nr:carboxypeptidase-like regulatory domain-containing protein [Phycisphaerales bacterium]